MGRGAAGCDDKGMANSEALIAFRKVTGWTDEQVIHYASCDICTAMAYRTEWDCPESPAATALAAQIRDLNARIRSQVGNGTPGPGEGA